MKELCLHWLLNNTRKFIQERNHINVTPCRESFCESGELGTYTRAHTNVMSANHLCSDFHMDEKT